jgi:3-dehydroquinate synthetase
VAIKAEVVAADEGERGRRQVLNFGHTVAHALEKATNHDLSHGQAVAIGMVVEGYLAQKLRGFPRADLHRLESLLRQFGLPTRPKLPFSAVQELFMADKKTLANQIYCSIPTELGTIDAQDGNWATHTNLDDLSGIWTSLQDTGIRGD